MRKLKLQMQLSVDGFVAGLNGEMDWMEWNWDDELKNYVTGLTDSADCIVLGRHLAEGFIPHWSAVAENPADPSFDFGKKMCNYPKIVFSRSMKNSEWANTSLAEGDFSEVITNLKNGKGKDILVYGGAAFAASLIKAGLIDEFHLFLNPAVVGKGMSIFTDLEQKQNLNLVKSLSFGCGIVLLCYTPRTNYDIR